MPAWSDPLISFLEIRAKFYDASATFCIQIFASTYLHPHICIHIEIAFLAYEFRSSTSIFFPTPNLNIEISLTTLVGVAELEYEFF